MRAPAVSTSILLCAWIAASSACSGSGRVTRWEPYEGCDAAQCQTWYEACRAECLNEGGSVGTCQTQCRAKREACAQDCGNP